MAVESAEVNHLSTKVSVVVPFYNVRDYLPDCVESVLAQTLGDIELILVDDGSTDGSGELADSYHAQYPATVSESYGE